MAPVACHDHGLPNRRSTVCQLSRVDGRVSLRSTAKGLKFTRSSDTALEGGLVAEASMSSRQAEAGPKKLVEPVVTPVDEVAEYLQPVVAAGKSAPPWLQAVARQVPQLKAWWRCVASSMGSAAADAKTHREGLTAMIQAAVQSSTEAAQRRIVDSLHAWAADWQDREGHLRKVMHA